jgi:3D (Asp-Asp-Asp) domain-containing protein
MRRAAAAAFAVGLAAGCAAGADWVEQGEGATELSRGGGGWIKGGQPDTAAARAGPREPAVPGAPGEEEDGETPILVREHGQPARRGGAAPAAAPAAAAGLFRNTYYDFPREGSGARDATLYDASCAPLSAVTRAFHDAVCVQGSGRLASGATVSFARRDCACAEVCPRTHQRVCFERLDPALFPHGRGAMGTPIAPLRTVAVDTDVIPLGTALFIPELVGLPRADGAPHDGCFVAEDRGIKVVGRQIDVFTGDPAMTARWNALFPSNRGVRVIPRDARCAGR